MYAVWTDNSNIWILSEKEIKMATKFQNVCPKLTDIYNHSFFSDNLYFDFGYQPEIFRICWQYTQLKKISGTQVVTQPKSKMAAKTQYGCRQYITVSLCYWTTKLILMTNEVLWWIHRNQMYKFQVEWKPKWPPNSTMSAQNRPI